MARPSLRTTRRAEIVTAFANVLSRHGFSGATIAAVAAEAGVAPGLVHHYFADKTDLLTSLVTDLVARFRRRTRSFESETDSLSSGGVRSTSAPPGRSAIDPLDAYISGALALGASADTVAARCWVGIFAEAVREPRLFEQMRRLLDAEVQSICSRSNAALDERGSGAVLAFIVGALVLGAFAPRKTAGFAAPSLRVLVRALARERTLMESA